MKKDFSFAAPFTPAKREKRVSFREPEPSAESSPTTPLDFQSDSTAASTPESHEKANGAARPKLKTKTSLSPLLANVSLSLTDWLPYPSQALESFPNTRLRWAVRTKDWQPSMREWEFMLSLLPQGDQDQVHVYSESSEVL